jgi:hypothetical protein
MGMFDTIFIEKSLPLKGEAKKAFQGKNWKEVDFQTKDLDETLSTYYIKKNGFLYHEKVDGDWVEDTTEETKRKKKEGKFYWPRIFVETSRKLNKKDFSGNINFYTSLMDNNGNEWWLQFSVNLVKGKVDGDISIVGTDLRRTAEKIKADEEDFKARMEAIDNHPWNKTRRVLNTATFGYWKKTWSVLAKGLRRAGSALDKTGFWLFRYM